MRRVSRRAFLAAGAGLCAAARGGWLSAAEQAPPAAVDYGNERRFEVVHQATFRNGQFRLDSLEMWVPLPQEDARQSVESLKVQPRVATSRDANRLATIARLYRTRGLPGPGEAVTLEVAYQVVLRTVVPDWTAIEPAAAQPYPNDRDFRLFTRPEKKIETRHPKIVEQAQHLRHRAAAPLAIARAAYDWVRGRTTYRQTDEFGGAACCLEKGHGECGDFSALFVALCRAAGVPARPVAGLWANETNGWHCWAEILLPNGTWLPVDAALGQGSRGAAEHFFGALDNRRVALCRTCDVDFGTTYGSHRQRDSLQQGACWWQGQQLNERPERPETGFRVVGKEGEVET